MTPAPLRILIVDDEATARARLRDLLEELGEDVDLEIVGEAASGLQALNAIEELRPDVALLDVVMPDLNGVEVAHKILDREPPRPLVIFQTGYDTFAVAAFEAAAVDYVLKPVSLDRLRLAVDRVRERLARAAPGGPAAAASDAAAAAPPPLLYEALDQLRAKLAPRKTRGLLVREKMGRYAVLPWDEITHVVAEERAVYARSGKLQKIVDLSLEKIVKLSGGAFIWVSRSALMNLDAVVAYESQGDGSARAKLSDGEWVHISRRRAADVLEALRGQIA